MSSKLNELCKAFRVGGIIRAYGAIWVYLLFAIKMIVG